MTEPTVDAVLDVVEQRIKIDLENINQQIKEVATALNTLKATKDYIVNLKDRLYRQLNQKKLIPEDISRRK